MSPLTRLAAVLTFLAAAAGGGGQAWAEPSSGAHTDTVTLGVPGQPAAQGTVNLQGFTQPIAPAALGPTPVQSSGVSLGGINVGALSEFGSAHSNHYDPATAGRSDSSVVGGYAGYRIASEHDPRSGYGVSLRFGSDPASSSETWRVQPGFDYTTALSASWQFSSRLFSTYNLDGVSTGRSSFAGGEERGFRDVGLGFGLGYAPSERWTVQTQATYSLPLRSQDKTRSAEEGESSSDFFGGVILNYKF